MTVHDRHVVHLRICGAHDVIKNSLQTYWPLFNSSKHDGRLVPFISPHYGYKYALFETSMGDAPLFVCSNLVTLRNSELQ